ncbi:MAG: hypothetical protein GY854_17140 [Deltaproteobacteria bacterium]|nr:hypothetical protein [Deltaproteobacteria bacterium]
MVQTKKWFGKMWWPVAICLAITAMAYQRVAEAGSDPGLSWEQTQVRDISLAASKSVVRYLCVGDLAFDLGDGDSPLVLGEDRIFFLDAEVRERCRFPGMPMIEDAKTLLSATAPSSGYAAALIDVGSPALEAVGVVRAGLARTGWREAGASRVSRQRNPGSAAGMYEREGAWLMTVGLQLPGRTGSLVLLAGRFDLGEVTP